MGHAAHRIPLAHGDKTILIFSFGVLMEYSPRARGQNGAGFAEGAQEAVFPSRTGTKLEYLLDVAVGLSIPPRTGTKPVMAFQKVVGLSIRSRTGQPC